MIVAKFLDTPGDLLCQRSDVGSEFRFSFFVGVENEIQVLGNRIVKRTDFRSLLLVEMIPLLS